MRINLEELEKSYIRVHYTSKRSKVLVVHELIALRPRVLIKQFFFYFD